MYKQRETNESRQNPIITIIADVIVIQRLDSGVIF